MRSEQHGGVEEETTAVVIKRSGRRFFSKGICEFLSVGHGSAIGNIGGKPAPHNDSVNSEMTIKWN